MSAQRLGATLTLLVFFSGCLHMDETVRTERGPLLRTFERPVVVPGGVRGQVSVSWPNLTVQVEGFDTCRTEVVDEYAEEQIRERSGSGMGAAVSIGVFLVATGIGLLAAQSLFSDQPDRTFIDTSGHYGPSKRHIERGWGIGVLTVGLAPLAIGLVGLLRAGSETQLVKVEQLASQKDTLCHPRALDGPLQLYAPNGPMVERATKAGEVTLAANELLGAGVANLRFAERQVELDDTSARALAAFCACVQLEQDSSAELAKRLELIRGCRPIRSDEMQNLQRELQEPAPAEP